MVVETTERDNKMLNPNDNTEDISANEMLIILLDDRAIHIDGKYYNLTDITGRLNNALAREYCEAILCGDGVQVRELYIQTIARLCHD